MNSIIPVKLPVIACPVPYFDTSVPAGFPSPAADHVQKALDLNEFLVEDPVATFFVKVSGDSMQDTGILDGTILVVDSGRQAVHGDIVVALVDSQYTVKRLIKTREGFELHAENQVKNYPIIKARMELQIFGVVVAAINRFSQPAKGPQKEGRRSSMVARKREVGE